MFNHTLKRYYADKKRGLEFVEAVLDDLEGNYALVAFYPDEYGNIIGAVGITPATQQQERLGYFFTFKDCLNAIVNEDGYEDESIRLPYEEIAYF